MTLQAEIQKRQQAVADLKRQVEQITALAGDDKQAGIRVTVRTASSHAPSNAARNLTTS